MNQCERLLVLLFSVRLVAQCAPLEWRTPSGTNGVNWDVHAMAYWDADGAGPLPGRLVVAGGFSLAGDTPVRQVAALDPETGSWQALGTGFNGSVYAVAASPQGDLYVGGSFTEYGGQPCRRIARWDGTAWQQLGSGISSMYVGGDRVEAILARASGEVWVGGSFYSSQGNNLVRWDGNGWSSIAFGVTGFVRDLAELPGAGILAVGGFTGAGGVVVNGVARWHGWGWAALGSGFSPADARAVDVLPNGDIVVTGVFQWAGGVHTSGAARWNGSQWYGMGATFVEGYAVAAQPDGSVLLGSERSPGILHHWNSSGWTTVATTPTVRARTNALARLPDGRTVFGGRFDAVGASPAQNIAVYDQGALLAVGTGLNQEVFAITAAPSGYVVGGAFTTDGQTTLNHVARWDGARWRSMGAGMNGPVYELATMANGDIVAAGWFADAGGVAASKIARWDGAAWQPLGSGFAEPIPVRALCALADGGLIAGGSFTSAGGVPAQYVAHWDGSQWSPLGTGVADWVEALHELPDGDVLVGGRFTSAGGVVVNGVARWDGSQWHALGGGTNDAVLAIVSLPDGQVVVGGDFSSAGGQPANRVARWDGTSWHAVGFGLDFPPQRLLLLPDDDIVAVGCRASGQGVVSRWTGTAWVNYAGDAVGCVADAAFPSDRLVTVGSFSRIGWMVASRVAELVAPCPPAIASYGSGCAGAAGVVALSSVTDPWLDSTFRARATGVPPHALAVGVFAFQATSIPLQQAHPLANPGCLLLVDDEILLQFRTGDGSVDTSIEIPFAPALVGFPFFHQVVVVELGPGCDIAALTASDALALTVGVF